MSNRRNSWDMGETFDRDFEEPEQPDTIIIQTVTHHDRTDEDKT